MAAIRTKLPIRIGPLLSVPVDVHSAVVTDKASAFHNVCVGTDDDAHTASRVRMTLGCPVCQRTTGFTKGQEIDGKLVLVTADELAATVDADLKDGMTLTFHPREQVASRTVNGDRCYFLKPSKGAESGYALLAHGLRTNPDRVACTIVALKGKPAMFTLGLFGDIVTLQKVAWPEDLADRPSVPTTVEHAYIPMFQQIVDSTATDFDPATFTDTQRTRRAELLATKTGVETVPFQPLPSDVPANVDLGLLAALQASVAAVVPPEAPKRPARRRTTSDADTEAPKRPARRRATPRAKAG